MTHTQRIARLGLAGGVFLLLAGVGYRASAQNGKGGQTAFEARAEKGDSRIRSAALAPLVTGDTSVNDPADHCEGATSVPNNNRGFFTAFRNCMDDIVLAGKDGVLGGAGSADDITLDRGSMSSHQDKTTGNVVAVQLYFQDLNDHQYSTDVLILPVSPPSPVSTTSSFTIHIHQENVEVRPQGGGNKPVVGHVSIGDVVFTLKPI